MCDAFLGLPWRGVQGCRARSHFSHFSFFGMTGLCGHAHPCSSTILPQIPIKLDKAQGRITRARHDTINMSGGALTARLCGPPASYHSPGHTFFRILPGAPIGSLCRTPLTGPRGLPMKKPPGAGCTPMGRSAVGRGGLKTSAPGCMGCGAGGRQGGARWAGLGLPGLTDRRAVIRGCPTG